MKHVHITNPDALDALFPLVDTDISTVTEDEVRAGEVAEIDALIEQAEREWAAAEQEETVRVMRDLTDQVRARRAHRRTGRMVLRQLPRHLGTADEGRAA